VTVDLEVDISRPPARLGPRVPLWVRLFVLWAIMLVVYILVLDLLIGPYNEASPPQYAPVFTIGLLIVGLSASFVMIYVQYRFVSDNSIVSSVLAARGFSLGDPEGAVRPSDPEERNAHRRFRRKQITRLDYERIIARRHFVHGELTHAEYNDIIRQLNEQDPSKGVVSSPLRGQQ
jgi:hypothetical protein